MVKFNLSGIVEVRENLDRQFRHDIDRLNYSKFVVQKSRQAAEVVDRLKKASYKCDDVIRDCQYDLRLLNRKLNSLGDRPDLDELNTKFESSQSKWLTDMAHMDELLGLRRYRTRIV